MTKTKKETELSQHVYKQAEQSCHMRLEPFYFLFIFRAAGWVTQLKHEIVIYAY